MAEARLTISYRFDFGDMIRQLREAADRLEDLQRSVDQDATPDIEDLPGTTPRLVKIDGQDVTEAVRGFTLKGEAGHVPQVTLDVFLTEGGTVDADAAVHIPAATAALLVALGWTPPDDGQPVDLTHPSRHDQIIKIIKVEARRDPNWLRTLLRREERVRGRPFSG
ncbi:hypothetical protein ACWD64_19945 [Streptomyces antibioticus]